MRALRLEVVLALAIAACGSHEMPQAEPASSPAPLSPQAIPPAWITERSTLGDTIVVATLGANDAGAELTLERTASIGLADGPPEQLLGDVNSAVATRNGGIIFYDGMARAIRWFDSAAKYVRTISAQGSGPGEIAPGTPIPASTSPGTVIQDRSIGKIALDSSGRIVAWNAQSRVLNVYNARGEFEQTWQSPFGRRTARGLAFTSGVVHTGGRLETSSGRIWAMLSMPAAREYYDPPVSSSKSPAAPAQQSAARREIWVEPVVYDVFAPTGEFLGRVRLPKGAALLSAAGNHIWLRNTDSLGVHTLVRYRLSTSVSNSPAAEYWARR